MRIAFNPVILQGIRIKSKEQVSYVNFGSNNVNQDNKSIAHVVSQKPSCDFLDISLQTKFRQILADDKKSETPILKKVKCGFIDRLADRIKNDKRNILISITGETASGKSTIAKTLQDFAKSKNFPVAVFSADNYFKDISKLIKKHKSFDALRDSGYDIDGPSNFQMDLLRKDLKKLANGKDVMIPEYQMNGTGSSKPKAIPVKAQKVILVEGICTNYDKVSDMFDAKVYVDIDPALQKEFFLKRAALRNSSEEEALKHLEYTKGAASKYIIPTKEKADIVVNGGVSTDRYKELFEKICKATK